MPKAEANPTHSATEVWEVVLAEGLFRERTCSRTTDTCPVRSLLPLVASLLFAFEYHPLLGDCYGCSLAQTMGENASPSTTTNLRVEAVGATKPSNPRLTVAFGIYRLRMC